MFVLAAFDVESEIALISGAWTISAKAGILLDVTRVGILPARYAVTTRGNGGRCVKRFASNSPNLGMCNYA